jgi:16S rRNA C967 or C1407 C5-methylase (RsmB/RsmF family)/NOL1/NOP2/fmu family ribosome biogenesis protein
MHLPKEFIESLQGLPGYDEGSFIKVHEAEEQVTSVRINPAKFPGKNTEDIISELSFLAPAIHKIPWTAYGYYLSERPSFTFDPWFHAGAYYVQEASSMFLEQAFKQLVNTEQPLKVLDLSAAPGGKTTHIQSLVGSDNLLVSNEVIRNRAMILRDNVIKWGSSNVVICNNDPSVFKNLGGFFDVIVVDAPCSGSGLFRKDPAAIEEWSLNNVAMCSQRQQKILGDVLPALKENGLLIYSTCSYSLEEDEEIVNWLEDNFQMQLKPLTLPVETGIVDSGNGYRFYPDKVKGEGFFLAALQKTTAEKESLPRQAKMEKATAKEKLVLQNWANLDGMAAFQEKGFYYMVPEKLLEDYSILRSVLNIQYPGTGLGQLVRDKLVPDHALALNPHLNAALPSTALDYETAIKYLQREEMDIKPKTQGWQTVSYKEKSLGWINALPNRINNYYPKELRILKRRN